MQHCYIYVFIAISVEQCSSAMLVVSNGHTFTVSLATLLLIYTHFSAESAIGNCDEIHSCMLSCRGSWMDVWELMSQECRDEVVLVDSAGLLETLETYLRKHR